METFSALLAFCAGNSPVTGDQHARCVCEMSVIILVCSYCRFVNFADLSHLSPWHKLFSVVALARHQNFPSYTINTVTDMFCTNCSIMGKKHSKQEYVFNLQCHEFGTSWVRVIKRSRSEQNSRLHYHLPPVSHPIIGLWSVLAHDVSTCTVIMAGWYTADVGRVSVLRS